MELIIVYLKAALQQLADYFDNIIDKRGRAFTLKSHLSLRIDIMKLPLVEKGECIQYLG